MKKAIKIPQEVDSTDVQLSFEFEPNWVNPYAGEQQAINAHIAHIERVGYTFGFGLDPVITLRKEDDCIILEVEDELWD